MKPIYVTQSFLPPLEDVTELLKGVWDRVYLTNNGPLLLELERRVTERNFGAETICVLNGTIAIELALQALEITGEVITTPFTFAATSTAIRKVGAKPVFVDIDPKTWNIDPDAVEAAITPETQAILAVHVFSRPCEVERLQQIADKHGLKLIYDGAHANFAKRGGKSIFDYGDCSTTSFHATKLFHTVEGGACFSPRPEIRERLRQLRFFGCDASKNPAIDGGTNAKMTEVSAAVGLANLNYLDDVLKTRRDMYFRYLDDLQGLGLVFQEFDPEEYNYSYFPVLFRDEQELLRVNEALNAEQIFPRRYFWPLLNDMPVFKDDRVCGSVDVAKNVSSRVLCLPFYPSLSEEDRRRIVGIVKNNL